MRCLFHRRCRQPQTRVAAAVSSTRIRYGAERAGDDRWALARGARNAAAVGWAGRGRPSADSAGAPAPPPPIVFELPPYCKIQYLSAAEHSSRLS
jgi:predicted oxidoreductase